jgi:PAS domain S-box-containing protein
MMSAVPIRILMVEDSASDAALLQESLSQASSGQFEITHVQTLAEAVAHWKQRPWEVMLLDLSLPDSTGQETFLRARAAMPGIPIVVLTGAASEAVGLEAVRQGIQDYLIKGQTDGAQVARAIRYAIERQRGETELRRARDELELRVAERTVDLKHSIEVLQKEISFREQAEQALRESEERYRTLFESAPMGIVMSTYQGKMIACNRSFCTMTRIEPEEARAMQAGDFHALPGQRRRLLAQARANGRVEPCEALLRRKDGSTFPVLVSMEGVQVGHEKVLLTIVQDITKSKQNERRVEGVRRLLELFATKASRQDYAASVTNFLQEWSGCHCAGVRLANSDGCLPYIATVGYNSVFLKQENCLSLGTADCPCSRIFRGRTVEIDALLTSHKGSFFCNRTGGFAERFCADPTNQTRVPCLQAGYASLAHVPIRYHGRLLGTIHLADLREDRLPLETVSFIESIAPLIAEALHRFEVEESLTESEQRFRRMFERHDAPMLLVDPESGAIEDANRAAAAFYGYSRERLRTMKKAGLNVMPPQAAVHPNRQVRQKGQNEFVVPHRLSSGEVRIVEVHSSPVQVKGRRLLFSIIHDITERKLLEKQMLDIGEAERQRIGQDLHDSLGGLLTGAALLGKALAHGLELKAKTEANLAEEVVRCINEAIGQTRSISRGLYPPELSIVGLAGGLSEFAAETTKRSGITCCFQAEEDVVIPNLSVASHLFRIVQEAVNNAIRHSGARRITIRLTQSRAGALLEVQDDGKGLPAGPPKGHGLGLRTMKYRADIVGAQFAIKSGGIRGTIVSCLVPNGPTPSPKAIEVLSYAK